jgi:inorganic pyrophosphatase
MPKSTTVTAMIESPKGSNQKFDYDPAEKHFKLSKILPSGMVFPFDFGMIPGPQGEDSNPLDIMVISEGAAFPGCLVECRVIGALKAEQTERNGDKVRNDRFIGIPEVSQLFSEIKTLEELPLAITSQLEAFFKNYNEQAGKKFKVTARLSARQAAKLLSQ